MGFLVRPRKLLGMARPAVFFDRDNTLIAADGYLGDSGQVKLIDGAALAVARLKRRGYAVVIISNQSGVARGMFGEEQVQAVNDRLDELLRDDDRDAVIDRHEYCPYHPEAVIELYRRDTPLRKPGPGMIFRAAEALGLDVTGSWVIGDAPRDIAAGRAAGCRTILFHDVSLAASPAAAEAMAAQPDFVVSTLKEAVDVIERLDRPEPEPMAAATSAVSVDLSRVEATAGALLEEIRSFRGEVPALLAKLPRPVVNVASPAAAGQPFLPAGKKPEPPFSTTKMLAGLAQMGAVAMAGGAFLHRADAAPLQTWLLMTLCVEALTIALLIMDRQR